MECTPKVIQQVKQHEHHGGVIWEKHAGNIQGSSIGHRLRP